MAFFPWGAGLVYHTRLILWAMTAAAMEVEGQGQLSQMARGMGATEDHCLQLPTAFRVSQMKTPTSREEWKGTRTSWVSLEVLDTEDGAVKCL